MHGTASDSQLHNALFGPIQLIHIHKKLDYYILVITTLELSTLSKCLAIS